MLQKKGKYRGKVYAGLYAGDGKGTQQRIQWQLNYYIAKAYGIKDHAHTKADGHYLWGPVRPSILFEELFHCWQIINDNYRPAFALNVEVEAKYAAYVYALHTGTTDNLFIPPTCSTRWWDAFASYYNEPSSYNYSRMIDSVRVSSPRYDCY